MSLIRPTSIVVVNCWLLLLMPMLAYVSSVIGTDLASPRTGYACEGSTLTIQCPAGTRIKILRANYGRFTPAVCNDDRNTDGWDMQCMSTRSLRTVTEMCGNRPSCSVMASNSLFGDTCSTTYKYLEIEYYCERENVSTTKSTTSQFIPEELVKMTTRDLRTPSIPTTTTTMATTTAATTTTTAADATAGVVTNTTIDLVSAVSELAPLSLVTSDLYCNAVTRRNIDWPRSAPGTSVIMQCPNNKDVKEAVWLCGTYPVAWVGRPDLSRCVSTSLTEIHEMLQDAPDQFNKLEAAADGLTTFAAMEEVIFGGDITTMMEAMKEAVDQVEVHVHDVTPDTGKNLAHKVNDAVLRSGSFLLDNRRVESWEDLPQATQAETATRLLSTVENSAYQVARTCQEPATIVNITVNIVIEVNIVDIRGNKKVDDVTFPSHDLMRRGSSWSSGGDSIRLTGETIKELGADGLAKIIFATYANLERYLQPQNDWHSVHEQKSRPVVTSTDSGHVHWLTQNDGDMTDSEHSLSDEEKKAAADREQKIIATKIISASVGERTTEMIPLKEPVIYTLEHKSDLNLYNPSCSFWEYSEKTMSGKWSTFGCKLLETNITHTTCSCQHLTNFAVLMSVSPTKLSVVHDFTLSLITYFGCILSIVCLILAFITFHAFKNLQSDRNTIHQNLVLSLLLAEAVFLLGIAQFKHIMLCSIIAGILHYLFLAAFAWMCLEGIQLYVMLVEVFEVEKSRVVWYYAAGYGVPAIIVGTSAAVFPGGYGTINHCWLKLEQGFIWAFVGPASVIICINIVMLSIAIYVMCRHASSAASSWKMKEKGQLENIQSWIKGCVVLIVLLGPTWAFGLFYINSQSLIMAYIFTILNSLQGVFIFVFHCLMNDKVIKEYKRWVRHASWLPSNLRIRCGGTKATPSTTPNNSSSSGGANRIVTEQKLSLEYLTRLLSNRRRKRSSVTSLPTSTNTVKRGYNKMQRHSSGHDSAHLTDSGIACCNNDDSHIYSEPTTEDPAAYLDPVRIRLDPDEELYWAGGEMSLMEGSVADTDYMDDFGRRGPVLTPAALGPINIDKYKIRPPPPSFPPPVVPTIDPDQLPVSEVRIIQPGALLMIPRQLSHCAEEHDVFRSDESLVRRKLIAMGEMVNDSGEVGPSSSTKSSTSTLMNNLNKCCSDASWSRDATGLSAPNIADSPSSSAKLVVGRVNHAAALQCSDAVETQSLGSGEQRRPKQTPIYASIGGGLDTITRGRKISAEQFQ